MPSKNEGPSAGDLPGEVKAWGAVSFLSDLAHEAVTSLLPVILSGMGAPALGLGLIEGASDAAATLAKLQGGRTADRAGRKKPFAALGYALTGAAIPAIALVRSWPAIGLLRLAGWVGRGFRSPIRDTLLVGAVPPRIRGRAFGLERAMDQMGAVLAPLLVLAFLGMDVEPRTIIGLTIIPGALAFACVLIFVREHGAQDPRPSPPGAEGSAALSEPEAALETGAPSRLRRFLLAVGVFGSGDFAKTLLVLWALGLEGGEVTLAAAGKGAALYALFSAVTVASAWMGGSLSDRFGRKKVLLAAYLSGAFGASLPVILSPGIGAGIAALALSGALVGAEESVERAWASDLAGPRRGRAFGWLHAVNGLGDLVASAGVGLLWTAAGPRIAFGAAGLCMLAGAVLLGRVEETNRGES